MKSQEAGGSGDMKIAWRYQHLPQVQVNNDMQDLIQFDLFGFDIAFNTLNWLCHDK